jgi:hypothetical protein
MRVEYRSHSFWMLKWHRNTDGGHGVIDAPFSLVQLAIFYELTREYEIIRNILRIINVCSTTS